MNSWQSILLDLGILTLLGVAYYYYQKRKIIRVDKYAILADIERFRLELNNFCDNKSQSSELKLFNNKFESIYESGNFSELIKLKPQGLNSELDHFYEALCQQIIDHLKITPSL